jgi:hypothetical protein
MDGLHPSYSVIYEVATTKIIVTVAQLGKTYHKASRDKLLFIFLMKPGIKPLKLPEMKVNGISTIWKKGATPL